MSYRLRETTTTTIVLLLLYECLCAWMCVGKCVTYAYSDLFYQNTAVERQHSLTPKMQFSKNWYLQNQEIMTNVTIVVGYAYLVIIPRPEQADRINSR